MDALRVMVFVDEANASAAARRLGRRIDWCAMRGFLANPEERRLLVEMVIYKGLPPAMGEFQEQREKQLRYVRWLRGQGFLVVTKDGVPQECGSGRYKSNMDAVMAIDAVDLSFDINPDVVVLLTGDVDFAYLAQKIRRRGIRVEVASAEHNLSSELRASANAVIDLTPLYESFEMWNERLAPAAQPDVAA